jgi:hypothetical protein
VDRELIIDRGSGEGVSLLEDKVLVELQKKSNQGFQVGAFTSARSKIMPG